MMDKENKRPTVAVIGGGIGGLTTAAFLHREGVNVHVYEQAAQLKEAGAGINLDSNATRILLRLGLGEQLKKTAVPLDEVWEFRHYEDGRVLYSEPSNPKFEAPHVVIHRGDLQNLLREKVPDEIISLNHRCANVVQHEDSVEVTFENGVTIEADAVIGADGPRSMVRNAVVDPPPIRFWAAAYRSLVPIEQVPESQRVPNRTAWLGPRRFFMRYPVSDGKQLNIFSTVPRREWNHDSWVVDAKVDDFLKEFQGWDKDVQKMISESPETRLWALNDMDPLERWTLNRVTLLGDAAHFMLPFMGQGAAQAMEDGAVLAGHLIGAETSEIPELLRFYEAVRKPRASMVQFTARTVWNFIDPPGTDPEIPYLPGGDPMNIYNSLFNKHEWLNGYDLEKDIIRKNIYQ